VTKRKPGRLTTGRLQSLRLFSTLHVSLIENCPILGSVSVTAMLRQLASCQIPMPERMAGMALLVAGVLPLRSLPWLLMLLSEGTPSICLPFVTQNDETRSHCGFCNPSSESEHGAEMASAPLAASRCLAELLRHVVGIDCRVKFRIVLRLFDRDRISLGSCFQTHLHRFFSHWRISISGPEFGTVRNLVMNGQSGLFTFDHGLLKSSPNGAVVSTIWACDFSFS
jgi:hypothetical protein